MPMQIQELHLWNGHNLLKLMIFMKSNRKYTNFRLAIRKLLDVDRI